MPTAFLLCYGLWKTRKNVTCGHIQVVSDRDGRTYCLNHAVECLRGSPLAAVNHKLFIRCEEVRQVV